MHMLFFFLYKMYFFLPSTNNFYFYKHIIKINFIYIEHKKIIDELE
jgi:hypothetical protein